MDMDCKLLRQDAVEILKKHGIEGPCVYLIDLIPLIEMIWADGKVQEAEVDILESYLKQHVAHINALSGYEIITEEDARNFISRYLEKRPDPELLKTLRSFIAPVRLSCSDEGVNEKIKSSLLSACLDIASAAVMEYTYGLNDRFNPSEKLCFFEILESFK